MFMINYDLDLLKEIIERDKCIINTIPNKLDGKSEILFVCVCGVEHKKVFTTIYRRGGAFCIKCTNINTQNKRKETCMEKYGFDTAIKSKEVQEKVKASCMARYGVDHQCKAKEVKEKIKETCMEKYGVDNPFKSKEVQKKNKTNIYRELWCG